MLSGASKPEWLCLTSGVRPPGLVLHIRSVAFLPGWYSAISAENQKHMMGNPASFGPNETQKPLLPGSQNTNGFWRSGGENSLGWSLGREEGIQGGGGLWWKKKGETSLGGNRQGSGQDGGRHPSTVSELGLVGGPAQRQPLPATCTGELSVLTSHTWSLNWLRHQLGLLVRTQPVCDVKDFGGTKKKKN